MRLLPPCFFGRPGGPGAAFRDHLGPVEGLNWALLQPLHCLQWASDGPDAPPTGILASHLWHMGLVCVSNNFSMSVAPSSVDESRSERRKRIHAVHKQCLAYGVHHPPQIRGGGGAEEAGGIAANVESATTRAIPFIHDSVTIICAGETRPRGSSHLRSFVRALSDQVSVDSATSCDDIDSPMHLRSMTCRHKSEELPP